MEYKPNEDGITHINIYSRAQTALGRFLTHFGRYPFSHPSLGNFESVEGLWYFIKTGSNDPLFRTLYGNAAKTYGKKQKDHFIHVENFLTLIEEGNIAKLETYTEFKNQLIQSDLPFTHYYVFGNGHWESGCFVWDDNVVTRTSQSSEHWINFWTTIREKLKQN